jgi:hypothetical protein
MQHNKIEMPGRDWHPRELRYWLEAGLKDFETEMEYLPERRRKPLLNRQRELCGAVYSLQGALWRSKDPDISLAIFDLLGDADLALAGFLFPFRVAANRRHESEARRHGAEADAKAAWVKSIPNLKGSRTRIVALIASRAVRGGAPMH